jgi:hypothetical protein
MHNNVVTFERHNAAQVRSALASTDLSLQLLACKVERLHDEVRDRLLELLCELSDAQVLLLDCKDVLQGRLPEPTASKVNQALGG